MRIAIDLDGVLADPVTELLGRIKKDFGIDINRLEVDRFEYPSHLKLQGIKRSWIDKQMNDEWFWVLSRPIAHNIETLMKWKNDDRHEVHIVTGRPKSLYLVTGGWLRKYNIRVDKVIHWDVMKKYEYLNEVGADVFFEDRFPEANRAAIEGYPSFVVRQPWNMKYEARVTNPLVRYVDSLSDAEEFINGARETL